MVFISIQSIRIHKLNVPDMRGFIALNDYEKYNKQKDELKPYYAELEK
jgi:hypothetical protein